jgi:hypothetical protein
MSYEEIRSVLFPEHNQTKPTSLFYGHTTETGMHDRLDNILWVLLTFVFTYLKDYLFEKIKIVAVMLYSALNGSVIRIITILINIFFNNNKKIQKSPTLNEIQIQQ